MKSKIIFTNTMSTTVSLEYAPKPSSHFLPEWYKKTNSYINNEKSIDMINTNTGTIKKCIPVFDVLTAGYIITTYADIYVKKNENGDISYIQSAGNVEYHPILQAPYHPFMNQHPYPKIVNPWSIKTPKGYSILIIPPVHGGNQFIKIAEGFVDTDKYHTAINFPFVLNDVNFEGLIPAGTPIAQIIPVKRSHWSHEIHKATDDSSFFNTEKLLRSKFYDRYKTLFWERKHYK
jgi:hypothetical protein